MCFFKKKSQAVKNNNDRELVEANSRSIESLLILTLNNEFSMELKELKEKLKYLTPSTKEQVFSFDKKIKEHIDDLKIELTKDADAGAKAQNLLKEIKLLISERNVNV